VAVPNSPRPHQQYDFKTEKQRIRREQEHWASHRQFRAARLEWDAAVRNIQSVGLQEDSGLQDLVLKSEALNRILRF
jgi:hypothetical protein